MTCVKIFRIYLKFKFFFHFHFTALKKPFQPILSLFVGPVFILLGSSSVTPISNNISPLMMSFQWFFWGFLPSFSLLDSSWLWLLFFFASPLYLLPIFDLFIYCIYVLSTLSLCQTLVLTKAQRILFFKLLGSTQIF